MTIDPTATPASITTGAASAQSAGTFAQGTYLVTASAAAWITLSATAVAGAAGNVLIPANCAIGIVVQTAGKIAAIQDAAAGKVCICRVG